MIKYIFLFVLFSLSGDIYEQAEEIIHKNLPIAISVNRKTIKIEAKLKSEIESLTQQKFFSETITYWKIFSSQKIKHYAFIDNVYGKSLPITFLVILNSDGSVNKVEIIKYREQYGYGVKNQNWLQQFMNFNSFSNYTIGKGVQGISGATISANSISKGVKKIVKLFEKVKNEL